MYKRVNYWEYARDWTEEQKERQFKLIKKQMKTAKSYKDCPALEIMFTIWNLFRFYKKAAESLLGFKFDINYEKKQNQNENVYG